MTEVSKKETYVFNKKCMFKFICKPCCIILQLETAQVHVKCTGSSKASSAENFPADISEFPYTVLLTQCKLYCIEYIPDWKSLDIFLCTRYISLMVWNFFLPFFQTLCVQPWILKRVLLKRYFTTKIPDRKKTNMDEVSPNSRLPTLKGCPHHEHQNQWEALLHYQKQS